MFSHDHSSWVVVCLSAVIQFGLMFFLMSFSCAELDEGTTVDTIEQQDGEYDIDCVPNDGTTCTDGSESHELTRFEVEKLQKLVDYFYANKRLDFREFQEVLSMLQFDHSLYPKTVYERSSCCPCCQGSLLPVSVTGRLILLFKEPRTVRVYNQKCNSCDLVVPYMNLKDGMLNHSCLSQQGLLFSLDFLALTHSMIMNGNSFNQVYNIHKTYLDLNTQRSFLPNPKAIIEAVYCLYSLVENWPGVSEESHCVLCGPTPFTMVVDYVWKTYCDVSQNDEPIPTVLRADEGYPGEGVCKGSLKRFWKGIEKASILPVVTNRRGRCLKAVRMALGYHINLTTPNMFVVAGSRTQDHSAVNTEVMKLPRLASVTALSCAELATEHEEDLSLHLNHLEENSLNVVPYSWSRLTLV